MSETAEKVCGTACVKEAQEAQAILDEVAEALESLEREIDTMKRDLGRAQDCLWRIEEGRSDG